MNIHSPLLFCCVVLVAAQASAEPGVDAKLKAAFARAATERVAVIGIGDSNQRFGGHGYTAAMPRALATVAPIYATDLLRYRQRREKDGPDPATAPEELARLASPGWYIPPGARENVSWKPGQLMVGADHPIDVRGPLRFHFTYGTFEHGASQFWPQVRRDTPPWTIIASAKTAIKTATGRYGVERLSLDLPANPARDYPVQFMPHTVREGIDGPFFAAYAIAENTARDHGLAYHTLHAVGGHSLFDMLTSLRKREEGDLGTWVGEVRALLNGSKTAVVMIHSGLNDRNRRQPSIGPRGGFESRTPEGYADNLTGMVNLLTEAWVAAGGEPMALHFAFMPSHALGDPDDARLVSYRRAARALADSMPNASMIDIPSLVSHSEMKNAGLYDKGRASDAHLAREGYVAVANALARELGR